MSKAEDLLPSAVSIRLDLRPALCIPFTGPAGGRSIFAGRTEDKDEEEEEDVVVFVVLVTSGGARELSANKL